MKNSQRKMKIGLACVIIAASFMGAAASVAIAEAKQNTVEREKITAEPLKASDLWKGNDVSFANHAEIPDYAKYGLFYNKQTQAYQWVNSSDEDLHLSDRERYGLKVTSKGGSIEFVNTVDLTNYTKGDELLSIMPTPLTQGTKDYNVLKFTLTDAEDPNSYFSFALSGEGFNQSCGWEVENPAVSASNRNSAGTSIDGFRLWSRLNGYTYMGDNTATTVKRYTPYTFSYDYKENTLYFSQPDGDRFYKIVDFDDVQSVGAGNTWNGFTSGKVRLSITVDELTTAQVSYMILGAFNHKMGGEIIEDADAPSLYADRLALDAPLAEVGSAYKLFACEAYDVAEGELPVQKQVLAADGTEIEVINGAFTPGIAGKYKIIYTAKDGSGNAAKKTVEIRCEQTLPILKIDFDGETETLRDAGEEIKIPTAIITGGSGNYALKTKVLRLDSLQEISLDAGKFTPYYAGEYEAVYEAEDYIGNVAQKSVVYRVANNFKPILRGEIQKLKKLNCGVAVDIPLPEVYDYSDPLGGSKKAAYKITATGSSGKVADVTSGVYTFDKDFGASVTFEYEMFIEGHEAQKIESAPYTVELIENMTSAVENLFAFNRDVYNVTVNGKGEVAYIRFDSKDGVSDAEGITYAYPFSESNIKLDYSICDYSLPEGTTAITNEEYNAHWLSGRWKMNYQNVKIEIRDSENAAIGFDYTLSRYIHPRYSRESENGHNNQRLLLNIGNESLLLDGTNDYFDFYRLGAWSNDHKTREATYRKATAPISISYSDGKLYNSLGNYITTVKTGIDGKPFNGFPSHKAYMTIKLEGVSGKVGISLSAAASFPLYTRYKESGETYFKNWQEPKIRLISGVNATYLLGETVKIPNAYAYYETASHLSVTFSVEDPDGNIVGEYNELPVGDGYSFIIDKRGTYVIYYQAKDPYSGSTGSNAVEITVEDNGLPTVLIDGETSIRVKAGESVALPDAIMQDDISDPEDIEVYVLLDDGNYGLKLIGKKDEKLKSFIAPTKKGKYKIRYVAVDSSSNLGYAEITLIVE